MKIKLSLAASCAAFSALVICASAALAQNPRQVPPPPSQKSDMKTPPDQMAMKGPHDSKSISAKDAAFLKMAAMGGMEEVEMGRMAEQRASSPEVKKIGQQMVADHSRMNKEVMALAKKKGVMLGKSVGSHELPATSFDRDYLNMMVKDHNKDITAFMGEAKNGEDLEVKALATKALPTLQHHLGMVKAAQKNVR